uniref:Cysteine and serine rich nuclear protein 2 n=3 Tax=Nothobranchius furzeri TaxID=105023 RepID=A0A8C6M4S9_NOTFU
MAMLGTDLTWELFDINDSKITRALFKAVFIVMKPHTQTFSSWLDLCCCCCGVLRQRVSMEAGSSLSLKRRYEEVDNSSIFSTPKDSDDDISSSDSADSCDSLNPPSSTTFTPTSILRQHKPSPGGKRVRFDMVTVYYFPRRQGFTSVPSQGGSSLGMARHHSSIRHYTLGEFAREQESSHRHTLRQHLRQEKLNARKMKLTRNGTVECAQADLLTLEDVSDEDLDVDAVEVDDCFFLQPLPTKRRRALLRASGIARIDAREKAELRAIRLSREECGCDCRLYCDPRHCGCSQAGIKCQVDRMSFPCGCSRDGCGNVAGRIEFNPLRVRTHYLHTIMKLDLEKRRTQIQGAAEQFADSDPSSPSSVCPTSPTLSSGVGLDSELEESEAHSVAEVQDLMVEQEILERENETAVLHLQSAEEQERREREEAEGEAVQQELDSGRLTEQPLCLLPGELPEQAEVPGVDQILLQGPFPTGATVLCISDNQEESPSELLKDSSSLLYYQLSPIEPGAFESLPRAEEDDHDELLQRGTELKKRKQDGVEELKADGHEDKVSSQNVDECLTGAILHSEEEEKHGSLQKNVLKEQRQKESVSETQVPPLPPEV